MLKRNLRVNSVKLKTTAYTSLVRPMDYGTVLWTIVQQHGTHTPIKTSQSWKPSNAVSARYITRNYERMLGTVTELLK